MTKEKLGKELKFKRLNQSRSINSFARFGLTYREVKSIEDGTTNYTIDKYLAYYNALKTTK